MAKIPPFRLLNTAYEDIDRMEIDGEDEVLTKIDAATQAKIIEQVNEEYDLSFKFNEEKRAVILSRLQLYNNQRRDSSAIGDPLMFTMFNTLHAALYDDRLMANWEGRGGEGDEDVEENLNALADFDYDIMGKSELDYYWNWDAEFTGRGLLLMMDFDRTKGIMAPAPELIDAVTWIRDPAAKSVNGDMMGRGGMRFGGTEVGATYHQLNKLPAYFNIGSLKKDKEVQSLLDQARAARSLAQGTNKFDPNEEALGIHNNYEFRLLNWFTQVNGKKYLVTLGNCRSVIVRLVELKYGRRWPIVDRTLYPMAHDWDGVSIPDLTEDKQRGRALLQNLGLEAAKADSMPQYVYDKDRIKNKNDLNMRSNKFIGVSGRVDNAILPLQRSTPNNFTSILMDGMDQAAQRALATPEIQMGVQSPDARTLGELNLMSSKVDTRYSMNAKVFGWSERAFWQQWYRQYKMHFKDGIDEKVIRIQGALAPLWRPLLRENIIADVDPDVKIESRVISEGKRQRDLQSYERFAGIALQNPDANRRYINRRLGKLNGLKKEELDMAFPKTVDEMQAEAENEKLNRNEFVAAKLTDDHLLHREIHAKANQNAASIVHMRMHDEMMLTKRDRPDLLPPAQEMPFKAQPGVPQINAPRPPTSVTQ